MCQLKLSQLRILLSFVILVSLAIYIYFNNYNKNLDEQFIAFATSHKPYKYISSCGLVGDDRGPGQKVISFSLYEGSKDFEFYKKGIEINLKSLKKIYNKNGSEWNIRIYSNWTTRTKEISLILDNNPEIDWCDVHLLFPEFYSSMNPRSWRFLPIGDPMVDIFLSRDIDAELVQREKDAVDEWLSSNYTFHAMRDHYYHQVPFLAGLWGAKLHQIQTEEALTIRDDLINAGHMNDQDMLIKYLYRRYMDEDEILAHDSYQCTRFGHPTLPWPTQRIGLDFVGQPVLRSEGVLKGIKPEFECPVVCRPKHGQNWTWC